MAEPSLPEESIFAQALEIESAAERAAFLDKACGDNAALRAGVEALLRASQKSGDLLDLPENPAETTDLPTAERPGTVIGPYKLIELIGEGGMGSVWMAQQTEPVKRLVALKLIKPGMDSRQVIARFEAERQALALMDHPNIARVFDGGTTKGEPGGVSPGRPYFVMELVKGVPLTKYCDEHRLTPKQRLELFVPVCQAIQHAHQKGIIHRDIKPSNVLVALYDGKPVPKVIDFGVAKATGQQLTERTLVTGFGAVVGTLEYMSPEQAELNQLDIDTRSDIYSLGVLLYELLTGSTPLERKRLKAAALMEVLRLIREEEPPRPSTRLSTTDELPSVAANRGLEPKKLSGLVRGELDWIVMKALDKDRNRRYETANGFAMDIQRYLADEPVQACPPSVGYRLRKFARRNKRALATMVLVAAALLTTVVALVISNISISRKDKEKSEALVAKDEALTEKSAALVAKDAALKDANASRQQAEANLTLILAALDEVYITEAEKRLAAYRNKPHQPDRTEDPRRAQVDRDFLQKGMSFYERLIQPGRAEPAARFQTGKAYRRVGILQSELKQYDKAADSLEKAGSLLEKLAKESPKEPQYRWELAQAYRWQGQVWPNCKVPQRAEAAQAFRRAAALAEELAAQSPSNPDYRVHAGTCRFNAGGVLAAMKRTPEAEAEYLEGLKLWQQLVADVPKERWYRHELAFNFDCLGWLWEGVNEPEKAEPFFRQALKYHEGLVAEDPTDADNHWRLARNREHLARVLTSVGHKKEAAKAFHEAIAAYREIIKLHPESAVAHCNLGNALRDQRRLDEAVAEYRGAIKLDPKFAWAHNNLGAALHDQGKVDEAVAEYREAIKLDPKNGLAHDNLGNALRDQGKVDEAVAEHRKAIELDPEDSVAHCNLGVALRDQGKVDEAIAEHREAIRLKKDFPEAHCNLGIALQHKRQLDEAIAEYQEALRLKKDYPEAHNYLGIALQHKGQLNEAIAEYQEALLLKKDFPEAHGNLGTVLADKGRLDEAIAEYREALRTKGPFPEAANAHNNLGLALAGQGKMDEAIDQYREAIRLKNDLPAAHYNLGLALSHKGRLDDAIAEYREAIRLKKDDPSKHYSLANALRDKGRLDEAIAEYGEALRLNQDYAEAHCNLAHVLRDKGQFAEALTHERRGHELGSKRPGWPYPSAQWVKAAEQLVEWDGKLQKVDKGEAKVKDAGESVALARLCHVYKRRYAAAERFYKDAFAAEPKLADDVRAVHRYNAACAAALAGCGQGEDAKSLGEEESARLRRQALDWLRADLAAWGRLLEQEPEKTGPALTKSMQHWQQDTDLAGVRGPEALAKLPEAERLQWQKLWDEVGEMLKRAQDKAAPKKK